MRKAEAVKYFKSQSALARALGIEQPSVAAWGEYPPDLRQLQIERITDGKLKAEPECEARVLGYELKRKTDRR
jgi:DNA-binding transcriptional regulator YdaS (Cro superfamily)